jgi:hypothetical protein
VAIWWRMTDQGSEPSCKPSGEGWRGDGGARHITSMFPAPLTSFAPTYMASSGQASYAVSGTPKAQENERVCWGHVGNL